MLLAANLAFSPAEPSRLLDLLEKEAKAYVQVTMATLPASEEKLEEIRQAQDQDEICEQ